MHAAPSSHPRPVRRWLSLLTLVGLALASTAFAQTTALLYKTAGQTSGHALRANTPSTGKLAATGRVTRVDRTSLTALTTLKADMQVTLPLTSTESVAGTVHLVQKTPAGVTRSGGTLDGGSGTFYLTSDGKNAGGFILRPALGVAYRFETDATGETVLREVPINAVVCGALPPFVNGAKPAATTNASPASAVPIINTRPSAVATLYLDFDGETVTDPAWAGGQTIKAASYNLSNSDIQAIVTRTGEDYRPFDINVTTDSTRYDNAPVGHRMRCIITPTDTAGPGAGGIAYLTSFWNAGPGRAFDDTIPCWVFNSDVVGISEAISHESGHTFGLSHDGREIPDGTGGTTHEEYYLGHGTGATSWCPIMGAAYYVNVSQFSKGEYQYANNQQDDLAIISDSDNGFGYAPDEAGTSTANAPALLGDFDGNVLQTGIIAVAGVTDLYYVTTTGGDATISAVGAPDPNLDIALTLFDNRGRVVAYNNPEKSLAASLTATLARGTYYLQVTDSGALDPFLTGYSTYGSIGAYTLTGSVPGLGVPLYPNLSFAAPIGADSKIVISNQKGQYTDAPTFYATDPLYLDLSVYNGDEGDARVPFTTTLYVDGAYKGVVTTTTSLISGERIFAYDYPLGNLSTGQHVITLRTDAANAIVESDKSDNTLSRTINVTVPGPPAITSEKTTTGLLGTFFTYAINATNVPTSYSASGLPPGLSVKPGTNLITGTPTVPGRFTATISATNILGTASSPLAINIIAVAPVVANPGTVLAEVGQPFSFQLPAANSPTSYAATGLPAGLTLDATSGVVSGTPTTAGNYPVTVKATNSGGTGTGTITLTVQGARPALTSAATARGRVSVAFTYQITATNGPTGYGAAGLPEGLSVNAATGLISGTPTTVGTYTVTLSATNETRTVTAPLTLTILDAPAVVAWGLTPQATVPADLDDDTVVGLAAGASHSLALHDDGTVEAWGANNAGQLDVPAGLGSVVSVSAGALHSLALRSDGTVHAWGDNSVQQTSVPADLTDVVAIAAGSFHNLALRADGTVVAWGDDSSGQIDVPAGLADVVGIAAGGAHSVALRADGTVVAWGNNRSRQATIPANLTGVRQVVAGEDFTLMLLVNHTVLAVGGNGSGQTTLPAGLSDVVSLAAGGTHALAVHTDGTVTAWGSNTAGESIPPKSLGNVALVAAGSSHSLALTQAGAPRTIAALPVNGSVHIGGTAFLFADAVGTGSLSYQWSHAGVDLPGETSSFLILDDLQAAQAGAYTFRVMNAAGSVTSAPANLTTTDPLPTLTVAPAIKQVPVGSVPFGEFLVTVTGNTTQDLVIHYSVKGSAVNGTDYTYLKGTKKLKAGKTTRPIKVFPLVNFPAGTKKTVELTLLPGDGYTVGTTKAVKVKIVGTAQ